MSDFTTAMRHNPHPAPAHKASRPTLMDDMVEAVLKALGIAGKTRELTQSDCKLFA